MVVQHNLTAMNANRYLGINNSKLSKSLEKLSSGYAINRAGDNAAGLAVSEKMRSQIAGMTQGVKNAQDGISMVQTFEGALTETDSILQRMKTLADQMANGSYDDPVDRTAAQQEFLQLNDELDQIADTDFNGVIVLNGGKMADGLEAVDGMFDYANKAAQVEAANAKALADAQAAAQKKIDNAQTTFDNAKAAYDNVTTRDLCLNGNAVQWNTVDDNAYGDTEANALFTAVKDGTDSLKDLGVDKFDATFEYTAPTTAGGTGTWAVKEAWYVKDDGTRVDLSATAKTELAATATKNGGFVVGANGKYGNAILEGANAKTGDVVTLTYTNTASRSYAPTNIGMDEESLDDKVGLSAAPKLALDAGINDALLAENSEVADALEKLDKASVEFLYAGDTDIVGKISDKDLILSTDDAKSGKFDISFTDSSGKTIKLATITMDKAGGKTKDTTGNDATITNATVAAGTTLNEAKSVTFTYKVDKDDSTKTGWYDDTDTMVKFGAGGTTGNAISAATDDGAGNAGTKNVTYASITVTGTPKDGDTLVLSTAVGEDEVKAKYNGSAATDGTVGTVKFGVALDEWNHDVSTKGPTIDPGLTAGNPNSTADATDSSAIDEAYNNAKKALADAKAAYPKTIEDLGDEYKVSKSDAFDKSEAQMTYKDSITLQTGARTKDAVNFTFQYNSDAIGDLKADLNCTAKGLGTDKLSLSTQEDANYAIDKIDQAINKVSLVRGTFGAIQNRLEHKIDNMNVSIENLTSAESQIRDTDMPTEMMNFTKQQILAQASQSMLAQANQLPQSVLSLLQ